MEAYAHCVNTCAIQYFSYYSLSIPNPFPCPAPSLQRYCPLLPHDSCGRILVILCTLYMYLTWAEADLRPRPSPVQFYSRLCITKQMAECYWSEESSPSVFRRSLEIHIIGDRGRVLRSGQPVQYLNNMSLGLKLSSTSGQPDFVAQ